MNYAMKEQRPSGSGQCMPLLVKGSGLHWGGGGCRCPPHPQTPSFSPYTTPSAEETGRWIHQGWFIFSFRDCTSGRRGLAATFLPAQTWSGAEPAPTHWVPPGPCQFTHAEPRHMHGQTLLGLKTTASKRNSHFEHQKGAEQPK